jgi:DNA repair protein RadD
VCFEHGGYARAKAAAWWKQRSHDAVPDTAQAAVDIANNGGLALTRAITVRSVAGEEFDTIVAAEIEPLQAVELVWGTEEFDPALVPF